jgi:flagellar biosynthetic protein FliP
MTAFLRIVLVLGFTRNAIGLQQMPPNQVIIGFSLFLTYFVMAPVLTEIYEVSVTPFMAGEISETDALSLAADPMKEFMLTQTRERDLALMANLAETPEFDTPEDVPLRVILPAFVVSELRTAFAIGFLLFVPFLVIDLSIAALLNALGMIMLPPTMVALPFKLLLFVLADGWSLLVGALVKSFAA